jgi:hypothetical protein
MCDAVEENKGAVIWLVKSGYNEWLLIAKAINAKIQRDEKKNPLGFLGGLLPKW